MVWGEFLTAYGKREVHRERAKRFHDILLGRTAVYE